MYWCGFEEMVTVLGRHIFEWAGSNYIGFI